MEWNNVGPESYVMKWEIDGVLARGHRPGYPKNRPSLQRIQQWTDIILDMGIKSIICLLDHDQMNYYDSVGFTLGGLLDYYRSLGLRAVHIPADDYKSPPLSQHQLLKVIEAFVLLEKPVLVHCSAGQDRAGAAVWHIKEALKNKSS